MAVTLQQIMDVVAAQFSSLDPYEVRFAGDWDDGGECHTSHIALALTWQSRVQQVLHDYLPSPVRVACIELESEMIPDQLHLLLRNFSPQSVVEHLRREGVPNIEARTIARVPGEPRGGKRW